MESEDSVLLGILAALCLLYYLIRKHRKDKEELFREVERVP